MRLKQLAAGLASCGVLALIGPLGCQDRAGDCKLNSEPCGDETSASTSSAGGGGGSGHGGGGGMGGGGAPPGGCVPSDNPSAVEDICGVFVSSSLGADRKAGSKSAPLASLAAAILKASADGVPVYACAEAFTEALLVSTPVTIYGGLDCAGGWAYVGASMKTALTAATDSVPLRLNAGASGTEIYDFAIEAADATVAGGSSIAIIADTVTAELVRCDVVAGKGAAGATGTAPSVIGPNNEGAIGLPGDTGKVGCVSSASLTGGNGGQNVCDGIDVAGGSGGQGQNATSGGGGSIGKPQPGPLGTEGLGGPGEDVSASAQCGSGTAGYQGAKGNAGPGAIGVGSLSASGYLGVSGNAGLTSGAPGQGGGGGGGAAKCGATTNAGPSGGGGGSGGCGGQPATGGGAGGSSIGIASVNASLTLTTVTISTAQAGDGGIGGDGQPGGGGGQPGLAGGPTGACAGGQGGAGGRGGSGGGGLGGHSIGIAFLGTLAPESTATITASAPGVGGIGGNADATISGAAGLGCKTLDFANAASCTK